MSAFILSRVRTTRFSRRRDHGQALPLLVVVVAVCALAVIGVGQIATALVDQQRARAAADAAALAGTTGGRASAARLAAANGATLVAFAEYGDDVVVTVEIDGRRATARASDGP